MSARAIRVHRCPCDRCKMSGRHFWFVTVKNLLPVTLMSFRDAINVADNYARRTK